MKRLVIVGLGLIGGSLAHAVRKRSAAQVVGVDLGKVVGSEPARRAAHELVDVADEAACQREYEAADIVVLATPVSRIAAQLPGVLVHANLVTDCGSTKRQIAEAAAGPHRSRFVPGHPMAGAPEGGIEHAGPDLFEGRRWLLCSDQVDPDKLLQVEALVRLVGAEPQRLSLAEHDRAVALTSHVPQLLASVLLVLAERDGRRGAGGPAFERLTRNAGGAVEMWREIFASNADQVSLALAELREALAATEQELAEGKVERALAWMLDARRLRD